VVTGGRRANHGNLPSCNRDQFRLPTSRGRGCIARVRDLHPVCIQHDAPERHPEIHPALVHGVCHRRSHDCHAWQGAQLREQSGMVCLQRGAGIRIAGVVGGRHRHQDEWHRNRNRSRFTDGRRDRASRAHACHGYASLIVGFDAAGARSRRENSGLLRTRPVSGLHRHHRRSSSHGNQDAGQHHAPPAQARARVVALHQRPQLQPSLHPHRGCRQCDQPGMRFPLTRTLVTIRQVHVHVTALLVAERTDIHVVQQSGNFQAIHDLLTVRGLGVLVSRPSRRAAKLRRARCRRARNTSRPTPVMRSISTRP
jgi:hypothetical protein